jgi:hypothetical protein
LFDISPEQLRKWRQHGLGPRYIRIAKRPYYRDFTRQDGRW